MIERFDSDNTGNLCYRQFVAHHRGLYQWSYNFLEKLARRDWHIVDAASGIGYGYDYLAPWGRYTGLDVSQEAIVDAKKRRPYAHYKQQDIEAYPPSADIVVCLETAEHLFDPAAFLAKLRCKWLLFSVPTCLTMDFDPYHRRDWGRSRWRSALRQAGFEVQYERPMQKVNCSFADFIAVTPTTWQQKQRIAAYNLAHPRYLFERFWTWIVGGRFRWTSTFFVCRRQEENAQL